MSSTDSPPLGSSRVETSRSATVLPVSISVLVAAALRLGKRRLPASERMRLIRHLEARASAEPTARMVLAWLACRPDRGGPADGEI
ncbi:hypothetical protein [Jiella sp. M17.18]|uniref:hypothetical protein n=1 Tax=Jiella sp. M17.18 TaxID=3234247 RepID=UPI0034E05456